MLAVRHVGVMPNPLDTREIFFTNLLLLGFDPVAMESREKIPFNRDMFALPNKKAMEIVMYFLFSKLNPQITYEEFRDCWPVKNKAEEQQFRKTCYNWVSRLAKEELDTNFPRVVQSLFHSPGGERFYNFLLLFSIYVLKVVMLRDHSRHVSMPPFPSKSIHNQNFTQVISKSYQVHTAIHRKRFLELTQYSIEVQHHWKAFAVELTKENRSLKKKIRELERQLKGDVKYKGEQMAQSFVMNNEYKKEADAIKRTQQMQKVRNLWRGVEDFYSAHKPQRDVVDSILEGQANKHQLDATDVQVKIPDLLLREFERDLHVKRIGNTYISGKLNLLSLIQLWNLSLNLLKDKIRQDSIPSFEKTSPKIKNDVHTHHSLLSNAESLRSMLAKETIPDLKQSVEKLKSKIYQDMAEQRGIGGPYPYSFNLGLGLAPATPPVSFTAAETPASHRILSFQDSLKRTPVGVSTPDVVSSWSESLRGKKSQAQTKPPMQRSDYIKTSRGKKTDMPSQIPKPKETLSGFQQNQIKRRQVTKALPNKGVSASAKKQFTPANSKRGSTSSTLMSSMKSKSLSKTEPRKMVFKGPTDHRYDDHDPNKASAAIDVANQIIGVMSLDRPDSASGSSSQSSSRGSTPTPQAIDDPIQALDDTAFVSRDLLMRTPAQKEKYGPTPVSHSSELNRDDDDLLKHSSTMSHQHQSETKGLSRSGRLLETILNQKNESLTAAKVKTALFPPSPKQQINSPFTNMLQVSDFNKQSSMPEPPINGSMFDKDELLLSPFAFETPKLSRDPLDNKQVEISELGEPRLMTPFSFVTPLSQGDSGRNVVLSPFLYKTPEECKKAVYKGPTTEPYRTPSKINGTDSPSILSDATEEKMRLSEGKLAHQSRTPARDFTTSLFSHSESPSLTGASLSMSFRNQGNSILDNVDAGNIHSPQISLFEPTIEHNGDEGLILSEDEIHHRLEQKNSPFGGFEISDDEGIPEVKSDDHHKGEHKQTPLKDNSVNESSYKDMRDSDLMNRLNKIKQAQRCDYMYSSPGIGSTKTDQQSPGEERDLSISDTIAKDVTMETIQAKRLDQIQEAQRGQQVTPGADTHVNLEPHRGTEPALLTPLTASSRGSPEHLTNEHAAKLTFENSTVTTRDATETFSNSSTPTTMLSERFFLKSPFGNEKDGYLNDSSLHRVFTLDSPVPSPDLNHNGFTPNLHTSLGSKNSPNGTPGYGLQLGKDYKTTPSEDLSTKQGARSSVDKSESVLTPMFTSKIRDNGKDFWMTSNGTTPKGFSISSDRRLSYDDFLNESFDSSFLVQGTPFNARAPKSLHGTTPPAFNGTDLAHATPDRAFALKAKESDVTATRSPAVGQLIDL